MAARVAALIATVFVLSAGMAASAQISPAPRRFLIEVTSLSGTGEVNVRGAVGFDGTLELVDARTPFRKELQSVGVIALFAVADGQGALKAVLFGERDGRMTRYGDVSGRAVRIIDEPGDPLVPLSFGHF